MSLTVFFFCYALANIPFAYASERYGRFPCLMLALILLGLGHLFCALSNHYTIFLIGRALAGFGAGGIILMIRCIQADRLYDHPEAYQITTIWITIWVGLFSDGSKILSAYFSPSIPWKNLYLLLAILSLFSLGIVLKKWQQAPLKINRSKDLSIKVTHVFCPTFFIGIGCYALSNGGISLILAHISLQLTDVHDAYRMLLFTGI